MARYRPMDEKSYSAIYQHEYDPSAPIKFGLRVPLNFTLEDYQEKEDQMDIEKTLYEIKRGDETLFGNRLAVNSQGQWVMEIKGSGDVVAVDKATVSEVIPYTIGIRFAQRGQVYNFFNEAKDLVKGDALIMDGYGTGGYQVALVVSVDTKSKETTKEVSYHKKF